MHLVKTFDEGHESVLWPAGNSRFDNSQHIADYTIQLMSTRIAYPFLLIHNKDAIINKQALEGVREGST